MAGDDALAAEFLEMIQPFRYPRSPGEGVLREVAAMKDRIENEVVKAGELDRNVKLGRGGIREIEFVAQTLQLIHAGRLPFLQGAQTLARRSKSWCNTNCSAATKPARWPAPMCFLRDVEHRLQMEDNQQTHTIPAEPAARERLAALMGFATLADFEAARRTHTRAVRRVYDQLLKADQPEPISSHCPCQFEGTEPEWRRILAGHSFMNVDHSLKLLNEFVHGPGYVHVSNRTVELASATLAQILRALSETARARPALIRGQRCCPIPTACLTRLDQFYHRLRRAGDAV